MKFTLHVHVFYKIILICFLISLAFNMFFTLMLVGVKLSGIYEIENGNFSFHIEPKVPQNTIAIPI